MRARTAIWLRSCSDRLVRCGSIRFRYLLHFFIIFTVLFVKCRSGNWWVLLTKMHILKNMLLSIKNKSSTEWTAIDCVGHRTHTRMCMCVCVWMLRVCALRGRIYFTMNFRWNTRSFLKTSTKLDAYRSSRQSLSIILVRKKNNWSSLSTKKENYFQDNFFLRLFFIIFFVLSKHRTRSHIYISL